MTLREFLSGRLGRLALWLGALAGSCLFLRATGTQSGVLVILLLAWSLLLVMEQVFEFITRRAYIAELEAILDGLDQKHLFAECAPKPKDAGGRRMLELMKKSGKAMIEAVSDAQASQRDYRETIESWVHEIKTPITAAQLLCRGAASELRRGLSQELAQIENHVERVLFYARAESPEKDFLIRQANLEDITARAIQHHQALLIQNGVRIETSGLDHILYTDGKWVSFMLGQLLQNAVRYRSEAPFISLSAKMLGRQVKLTVQDNGIGIPRHELPRIFDRGFTGVNGRIRGGSTGMGLYLCRRLADSLEIGLAVQSDEGRGTCVTLTFPTKENLSKV